MRQGAVLPTPSDQCIGTCRGNLPVLWPCWLYLIKFDKKKQTNKHTESILRAKHCGKIKYNKIQGPAEVMPVSVVGGVCECLTRDGQQFEPFT